MQILPSKTIVTVALISESILALLALTWAYWRAIPIELGLSQENFLIGIKATGPILAFNFGIFAVLAKRKRYSVYKRFLEEVIIPVIGNLGFFSAALVALCAGIGEELFFRAVLNIELIEHFGVFIGITTGSILFAYVHFLNLIKEYWQVFLLYVLFGLYFSYLAYIKIALLPVIICHALYNYIAIIYIRFYEVKLISNE